MSDIRIGLVGYGAWGRHHARAIGKTAGTRLTAVAVRSEETRLAALAELPGCAVCADYRELVRRDDVDVVDVVVPADLHFEIASAALESGKHLLLEKPMALTVDDCRRITALAKERRRVLAVGFEMRVSELWGKTKEMIAAGAIGEIQYVTIDLARRPYRPGSQAWRFDARRVGNWILEEPIHFFDLACWYFAGAGKAVSVYAAAASKDPARPALRDHFSALLKFSNGGHAAINQTLGAFGHHQEVKAVGRRGALWAKWSGAMDRDPHPTASLRHFDGDRTRDVPLNRPTGEFYELEDEIAMLARSIREGTLPAAGGAEGTEAVRLCLAAESSVERGVATLLEEA